METRLAYLDAYIELSGDILESAYALNRRVRAAAGGTIDFAVGTVPHITLYMGLFPEEELEPVKREMEKTAAATLPFPISLNGIQTGREGYLFWHVDVTGPLRRLHERLVEAMSPLRRGAVRQKYLDGLNDFTPEERRNIRDYGFPWVFQQFRPHLTIGCVGDENVSAAAVALGRPEASGNVTAMALGTVGDRGVVLSTCGKFPLSGRF